MIALNAIEINEGFSGIVSLGEVDKLFVSGDGGVYSLYGTVFRLEDKASIIPPSEGVVLPSGSIEWFLKTSLERRLGVAEETLRLEDVRKAVVDGKYDYGVSSVLMEDLEFLSSNTVKPLPSVIVGGQLGYEELEKNNSEEQEFEDRWEAWSHVYPGLKRYDAENQRDYAVKVDDLSTRCPPAAQTNVEIVVPGPLTATIISQPNGTTDQVMGDVVEQWKYNEDEWAELIIGTSTRVIGDLAFWRCHGLVGKLTIPFSVREIGGHGFQSCTGLTELEIQRGVITIDGWAFYDCSGFTGSLKLPNSVIEIGRKAFYECDGFDGELRIPDSVATIGTYAFYGCSGMVGTLTLSNSLEVVEDSAFRNCSGFTGDLVIPTSVTVIESTAFDGCSGLTGLIIPSSTESVGARAFEDCTGIIHAYLDVPLSAISSDTFENSGLTNIHLHDPMPAGWSEGSGQTIGGKSGITVTKDWA